MATQGGPTTRTTPKAEEESRGDREAQEWTFDDLGRNAQIYAGASAEHATCSKCVDATNDIVLSTWRTGETLTTSGEDVVLHLTVDGVGGEPLPAGEVTIEAGVSTSVRNGRTWGDDSASVDAVVEQIALLR